MAVVSLLVKIEGDPLNTQEEEEEVVFTRANRGGSAQGGGGGGGGSGSHEEIGDSANGGRGYLLAPHLLYNTR